MVYISVQKTGHSGNSAIHFAGQVKKQEKNNLIMRSEILTVMSNKIMVFCCLMPCCLVGM